MGAKNETAKNREQFTFLHEPHCMGTQTGRTCFRLWQYARTFEPPQRPPTRVPQRVFSKPSSSLFLPLLSPSCHSYPQLPPISPVAIHIPSSSRILCSNMTTSDPSISPSGVLSHWVRSTPEEGIQCLFNRKEVHTAGVQLHTEDSREDSSCQWVISLRPLESCYPLQTADPPSSVPSISGIGSNSALLLLTLGRVIKRDGTGPMRIEDDPSPGYQRSDHYRTMYVYSPKTRRDVCMQQMRKGHWPQTGENLCRAH